MEEISPEAPETGADEVGGVDPSESELHEGFSDDVPEGDEREEVPADKPDEGTPPP